MANAALHSPDGECLTSTLKTMLHAKVRLRQYEISLYCNEPEASANEPANTSLYPEEEAEPSKDDLTTSFYQPVTTSFSYSAKTTNYDCVSNIIERIGALMTLMHPHFKPKDEMRDQQRINSSPAEVGASSH